MSMLRLTLVIVEPAGMLPATSKARTPRRRRTWSVLPAKKRVPAPLLRSPSATTYWPAPD